MALEVLGFLLLAACAALSASLLTWSVADPSLSARHQRPARNLLGPPAPMLSDLHHADAGPGRRIRAAAAAVLGARAADIASSSPSLRGKLAAGAAGRACSSPARSRRCRRPRLAAAPRLRRPARRPRPRPAGEPARARQSRTARPPPPASSALPAASMALMWSLGLTQRDLKLICQTQRAGRAVAGCAGRLVGSCRPFASVSWLPRAAGTVAAREPPVFARASRRCEAPPVADRADRARAASRSRHPQMPTEVPTSGRGRAFDDVHRPAHAAPSPSASPRRRERPQAAPASAREPAARAARIRAAPACHATSAPSPTAAAGATPCRRPPLNMLKRRSRPRPGRSPPRRELRGQARLLEERAGDFGVRARSRTSIPGPSSRCSSSSRRAAPSRRA